jgi:hypothetical protein
VIAMISLRVAGVSGEGRAAVVEWLAQRAISEALSISEQVIAVVVTSEASPDTSPDRDLQERWARWNPGPPLRVLHSEYASIAGPILAFLDELRGQRTEQIVVLISDRLRYRFLHDHVGLVLTSALRDRTDIVTARVPVPLYLPDRQRGTRGWGLWHDPGRMAVGEGHEL